MDVSPYEGTVEVRIGDSGIVVMRERIPGGDREHADKVRMRISTSAKARTTDSKIAAEDMSVSTEMDEAAYHLALLDAFIVSWNLTRHGVLIPLTPAPVREASIRGLPDPLYTPLVKKALELVEAASRTTEDQVQFQPGSGDGGAHRVHI